MNNDFATTTTQWHPLNGMPIGYLPGLSPGTDTQVHITEVSEETHDLAIADRVAHLLTEQSGATHVVLAGSDRYIVAQLQPELDWAASMRLIPDAQMPRITSVAAQGGILPILIAAS